EMLLKGRADRIEYAEGDDEGQNETEDVFSHIEHEHDIDMLAEVLRASPVSVCCIHHELQQKTSIAWPGETTRLLRDALAVLVLRILGHRWPMQDQYEEERGEPFLDSKWIDEDGIIPLIAGTGEETLADRLRRYLDDEYGSDRGPEVEKEITMALGWKAGQQWGSQKAMSLDHWLKREFFKRHVSQFKKRPIAWHLTSEKGTFQTIVYYHKFDKNRLQLLRSRYVRQMLDELQRELGATRGESMNREALARVEELENKIEDVRRFDERLQLLLEGRERDARIWCPWKSEGEQPQGWDPDINDGVRVNIAPIQRLELLAGPVLSKKDLNSLLAPEERS
ncbi:MAG: hypothetical protein KAY24_19780, partial [Candidatus Eisenbacteria sp.]|nr:hypothetical protein [Candidatus Eisenbacteria bacterium]